MQPIASPVTGELLAEAGEMLTREKAYEIEQAGVSVAYLDVEGKEVKVISNGMVDISGYVDFPQEELEDIGINEKVRFTVLMEILEKCGDDRDALFARVEKPL